MFTFRTSILSMLDPYCPSFLLQSLLMLPECALHLSSFLVVSSMFHSIFSTVSVPPLPPAQSLTTESRLKRHTYFLLLLFFLSSASSHPTVSCQPFWNSGFSSVVFYHTNDFFIECFKFIVRWSHALPLPLRTFPEDPPCLWVNLHGA